MRRDSPLIFPLFLSSLADQKYPTTIDRRLGYDSTAGLAKLSATSRADEDEKRISSQSPLDQPAFTARILLRSAHTSFTRGNENPVCENVQSIRVHREHVAPGGFH